MPRAANSRRAVTQRIAEIQRRRDELAAEDAKLKAELESLEEQLKQTQTTPPKAEETESAALPTPAGNNTKLAEPDTKVAPKKSSPTKAQPTRKQLQKQKAEEAELDKMLAAWNKEATQVTNANSTESQVADGTATSLKTVSTKASRKAKRAELQEQKQKQNDAQMTHYLQFRAMLNKINLGSATNHANTTEAN